MQNRFDNVPDFPIGLLKPVKPVKFEFWDDELQGVPATRLQHYAAEDIVNIGRVVIPMVTTGFSKRGIASILLLAYHLIEPGSDYRTYMFSGKDVPTTIQDSLYDDYSDTVMNGSQQKIRMIPLGNVHKETAVYAFIAASMLRLFTKPVTNYINSWYHILSGFKTFYGEEIGMNIPTPTQHALESFASTINVDITSKNTLYRILYVSNNDKTHLELKRFLYDTHLSYTGMHLFDFFQNLCSILKCEPDVILKFIESKEFEEQTTCLEHLVKLMRSDDNRHERRMWRYGRLFNENFMYDIRVKSCRNLVYVFASALKSVAPDKYKHVMGIPEFATMPDEVRRMCDRGVRNLLNIAPSEVEKNMNCSKINN